MTRLIDADEYRKRIDRYPPDIRDIAKKELRYVKTIEAEPIRHGRWINDEGLYKCSVCNNFATIAGFASCIPIEQMNKAMKYCNSCGAKMDEGNDDFNR